MSRRTRYTPEQKVKIVTACIDGENSIRGIARQYRISGGRIASVPGPGGIIAEFIGYAQEKTLAKRQQEMFDLINIRLNRLQDRIDELASNEFCVTIAQKTYAFYKPQPQNLCAIRNHLIRVLIHAFYCHLPDDLVVDYQDTRIDISQGNIDLRDTHKQIVDIMEGGKDAFEKRQLIYESWR